MKTITFKREHIPLLLSGEKRSTVRTIFRRYRVGEEVLLTAGDGDFRALAKIHRIDVKRLGDIDEEDLSKEGVRDRKALFRALKKYYRRRIDEETMIQIVHFEIIKDFH